MRRIVAAATVLAGLLAACSSGGSPDATPSPSSGSPGTATSAPPATSSPSTSPAPPLKHGPPRRALVGTFVQPVYVTAPAGDPRVFVVEQAGRIRIVRGGRTLPAPFLDIRSLVLNSGERGLLSMAFPPDFATSRRFYVDYNATDGDLRIAEFRVGADPNRADSGSRRELLRIDKPYPNHNGGLVAFDRAGMLLIGVGDGGSGNDPGNRAQNLGDLHGKVLRIDPRPSGGRPYAIPPDNPYAHRSGARPEVWAYGLRNPWRFAFDPPTGVLYIGDVGQNDVEEIDAVPPARQPGANYGWRVYEGRSRNFDERVDTTGPLVFPVHTYGHGGGRCTVIGGVVYRGSVAALRGRYLFGDYCSGELWSFAAGTADRPRVTGLPFGGGQLTSFGVDGAGEVYLCAAGGQVWRITA